MGREGGAAGVLVGRGMWAPVLAASEAVHPRRKGTAVLPPKPFLDNLLAGAAGLLQQVDVVHDE